MLLIRQTSLHFVIAFICIAVISLAALPNRAAEQKSSANEGANKKTFDRPAQYQIDVGRDFEPETIGVCDFAAPIEVESTGGTTTPTAYPTLKVAFDAVNAGIHTGSINIEVCGDTIETDTASLNASAAPSSYTDVTLRPVGGSRIIEGSIDGAIVKLNGADNVTIDGRQGGAGSARDLTIRNHSTLHLTAAIWLASVVPTNGATNNVIRNLEIAAGQTSNLHGFTTIGIFVGGTIISLFSTGADNDNNQFVFNRITKARYGIASIGVATNNNLNSVISDNIIGPSSFGADQIGKVGILMEADTGAIVSRNIVQFVGGDLANTTNLESGDRCGICIGGENWSQTGGSSITSGDYTVTGNVVHDVVEERTFSAVGIRLGTIRSGSATNNLVANNFIYNIRSNGTSGDQVAGIGYAAGHTDRVVFNSISLTGDMDPGAATSSGGYGNAIRVASGGTVNANLTLMNNSVYMDVNSNTASNRYYAITILSATYPFGTGGLNNNNYYVNLANPQMRTGATGSFPSVGTQYATLADWKAVFTIDTNSIQENPFYFSNTSNLHIPTNSPNVDAGAAIAGIADDIDNQVRPRGAAPDIGADEAYEAVGTIQLSSTTYSVTEVALTAAITVIRTSGSNGAVSVDLAAVAGGSATGGAACTAGIDFIDAPETLVWADLEFGPKTFTITVCNDGVAEPSETLNLQLSNPQGGATLETPSTAVLTIVNSTTFGSSVNVGTDEGIMSLTNPGGLFDQINTGALSANLTVDLTTDLTEETGTVPLNEFTGGFMLTIRPSPGASRIVSGGNATALIDIRGADNVHVNGSHAGSSLLIRNTGSGTGTVLRFINDASNNSLLSATLEGGGTSSVLSISAPVTTGNDHIAIVGNVIRDRTDVSSVPFNTINLIGSSAAISNSNILIDRNQLINFRQAGIVVSNSDAVTFTKNDIFQTESRTSALIGVGVNSVFGTGNLFSQNTIHNLTTSLATTGMQFSDTRDLTVSRNHIYNFPSTSGSNSRLTGIMFFGALNRLALVTIVNNMVTIIPSFTNSQEISGIRDFGRAANTFNSYFNTVLVGGTESGPNSSWACVRGTAAPSAHTMMDNICFNNRSGGTGNHFAAGDHSNGAGTFTSDYNIFVGTGAIASAFFDKRAGFTPTPVDFATWQAGERDLNSQASIPGGDYTVENMFVSSTNLHLNRSGTNPALSAATPIAGITIDIDGDTRFTPFLEIGADELIHGRPQ